jgi:hypothetical protein
MKLLLYTFVAVLFLTVGTASAQTEKKPTAAPALDSVLIKEYSGKYDVASLGMIIITWEQDKLTSTLEGKGSAELKPTTTPDVLTIVGYGGTITFVRDEKKKVIKAILDVQGQEFEGVKN